MAFRITSKMMANTFINNYHASLSRMEKYQRQMATNKRILRLSDDPIGAMTGLNARTRIYRVEQYQKNVESAQTWLEMAETSLLDMNEVIKDSYEQTINAATNAKNADDKRAIAEVLKQYSDHILSQLNSTYGDKYMFGGYNMTVKPFSVDGATGDLYYNGINVTQIDDMLYDPVAGTYGGTDLKPNAFAVGTPEYAAQQIYTAGIAVSPTFNQAQYDAAAGTYNGADIKPPAAAAGDALVAQQLWENNIDISAMNMTLYDGAVGTYNGTDIKPHILATPPNTAAEVEAQKLYIEQQEELQFELGFGLIMDVAVSGLGVTGIGEDNLFAVFHRATQNLMNDESIDVITEEIEKLQDAQSRGLSLDASIGGRVNRLDLLEQRYKTDWLHYTEQKSNIEDVDQAEAIMNFMMAQAVYNSMLQTGAQIIQPTLVNFL